MAPDRGPSRLGCVGAAGCFIAGSCVFLPLKRLKAMQGWAVSCPEGASTQFKVQSVPQQLSSVFFGK